MEYKNTFANFVSNLTEEAVVTVESNNFKLIQTADALYYITDASNKSPMENRFFLHVYPLDTSLSPEVNTDGFINLDFDWREHLIDLSAYKNADNYQVGKISIPNQDYLVIETGQVNESGRIWGADLKKL